MSIHLENRTNEELTQMIGLARELLRTRNSSPGKLVPVTLDLQSAGRTWVKTVEGIDPKQCGAYAILGSFAQKSVEMEEGDFLLLGGTIGSGKTASRYYALVQVNRGVSFDTRNDKFTFSGSGAKLVTTSKDQVDPCTEQHPDLARRAQEETFPILVALRESGF